MVGYLGYECAQLTLPIQLRHRSPYPDAYFIRPQSFLVYDHHRQVANLCCLDGDGAQGLLDRLEAALKGGQVGSEGAASASAGAWRTTDYLDRIQRAQELLHAGESYEVCLTDTYTAQATGDIYAALRQHNPAPYAAHLVFDGVEICSASPERFLSVRDNRVEAKPIKGTFQPTRTPRCFAMTPRPAPKTS